VNVIDYENLTLDAPHMVHDLPGGARRFTQTSSGYRVTVKHGEVILRDGQDQGVRVGELLRGPRA
jgi:N-acyl-D-amino-acid deacylase